MDKTTLNPDWALKSRPRGYSHVVRVDNPVAIIHLAGQAPVDAEMKVIGEGDIAAQTRATFMNIRRHLEEAGASLDDVVKMVVYLTDIQNHQWPVRDVRSEFFDSENPPASTMIEVSRLALEGMMIEIDVVAIQ